MSNTNESLTCHSGASRATFLCWKPDKRHCVQYYTPLCIRQLWSCMNRQSMNLDTAVCSAVHCSAVQCSAVQRRGRSVNWAVTTFGAESPWARFYCRVLCSAVQCSAVQCSAVQCSGRDSIAECCLYSILAFYGVNTRTCRPFSLARHDLWDRIGIWRK
jgi:hypothetical protein